MPNIYYKLQYFDAVSLSWKDVQKKFNESCDAIRYAHNSLKEISYGLPLPSSAPQYRVVEVRGKVRSVITSLVV